jgi:hypothetical protein
MTSLAEEYLMRLFEVSSKDQIPPVSYINLHICQSDTRKSSSLLSIFGVVILLAGVVMCL